MALFGKKNRDEDLELPKFPDLPEEPSFPSYEPEFANLEDETPDEFGIPERRPSFGADRERTPRFEAPEKRVVDKPVFVKIEQYREALDNIEDIKTKIKEAEELLASLDHLKTQEDHELQNWHNAINRIKEKLISVDRKLFEG